ncbi:MAG TPA: hypothetical protein VH951_01100, partial [Dehalococcoidia bacterium]
MNLLMLAGMAVAVAFAGWQGLHRHSDRSAPVIASCASGCRPPAAVDVKSQAVATVASTPCAYCNQDPQRWRQLTSVPPPELNSKASAVLEA